jgi:hypothetical protein
MNMDRDFESVLAQSEASLKQELALRSPGQAGEAQVSLAGTGLRLKWANRLFVTLLFAASGLVFLGMWRLLGDLRTHIADYQSLGQKGFVAVQAVDRELARLFLLQRDFVSEDLVSKVRARKAPLDAQIDLVKQKLEMLDTELKGSAVARVPVLKQAFDRWEQGNQQIETYALNGDLDSAQTAYNERGDLLRSQLASTLKELLLDQAQGQSDQSDTLDKSFERAQTWAVVLSVFLWLITLMGTGLLHFYQKSLQDSLQRVWGQLQKIHTESPSSRVAAALESDGEAFHLRLAQTLEAYKKIESEMRALHQIAHGRTQKLEDAYESQKLNERVAKLQSEFLRDIEVLLGRREVVKLIGAVSNDKAA